MDYSPSAGTPTLQLGSPLPAGGAARAGDLDPALQPSRYGAMTADVSAFLAQLRRTPVEAWRDAAEADGHMGAQADLGAAPVRGKGADRRARARLRELMDAMPDVVRRIRAHIDDDLTIIEGIAPPVAVARMRRAARLAACAIAARPSLTPDEFARLYRPFTALIPFRPRDAR